MAKENNKRFFVIESSGYCYAVSYKSLKVADAGAVELGDRVTFQNGKNKTSKGKVLFISAREEDADEKSSELSRLKTVKQDSFYEGKPRKTALKQRQIMTYLVRTKNDLPADSSKKLPKKSRAVKNKRLMAEAAMQLGDGDKELTNSGQSSSDDSDSDDQCESTNDSCASSFIKEPKSDKKRGTAENIKLLQELDTANEENGSHDELTQNLQQGECSVKVHSSPPNVDQPLPEGTVRPSNQPGSFKVVNSNSTDNGVPPSELPGSSKNLLGPHVTKTKPKTKIQPSEKRKSSSSSEEDKVTRRKKLNEGKKPKKIKPRDPSSERDVQDRTKKENPTNDSSSESEEAVSKPVLKKSHSQKATKRNIEIYPGQNYLHSSSTPHAVRLHENFDVYVLKKDLDICRRAKSASIFLRQIVDRVYTLEALQNSTPQGFPKRSKGRKYYKKAPSVLPRLHPDGLEAIAAQVADLEEEIKSWRPRLKAPDVSRVLSNKICGFKVKLSESSDE